MSKPKKERGLSRSSLRFIAQTYAQLLTCNWPPVREFFIQAYAQELGLRGFEKGYFQRQMHKLTQRAVSV